MSNATQESQLKSTAVKFVIVIGIVSLFADWAYEGARSITGPYLAILGASGALVGFIAGFGELLGYGLRVVSGKLSGAWAWASTNPSFPRLSQPWSRNGAAHQRTGRSPPRMA
jgi:hypothetical protein